jgi:hypothetical protein
MTMFEVNQFLDQSAIRGTPRCVCDLLFGCAKNHRRFLGQEQFMKTLQFGLIGLAALTIALVAFSGISSLSLFVAPRLLVFAQRHTSLLNLFWIFELVLFVIISRVRNSSDGA